jgi:hypothetical protein
VIRSSSELLGYFRAFKSEWPLSVGYICHPISNAVRVSVPAGNELCANSCLGCHRTSCYSNTFTILLG